MSFRPFSVLLVFFAVAMPAEAFLVVLALQFVWTRPPEFHEIPSTAVDDQSAPESDLVSDSELESVQIPEYENSQG